ncbi:hypothetical protein GJ496_000134 [Pomphorhynchus laevis]|nr:hypothetical protein GJ496_000134 [Pomphorhynchus laevis]
MLKVYDCIPHYSIKVDQRENIDNIACTTDWDHCYSSNINVLQQNLLFASPINYPLIQSKCCGLKDNMNIESSSCNLYTETNCNSRVIELQCNEPKQKNSKKERRKRICYQQHQVHTLENMLTPRESRYGLKIDEQRKELEEIGMYLQFYLTTRGQLLG